MENTQSVEVIFGKGCFALTTKNIASCTKALKAYKANKTWTWSVQDTLCITMSGKKSPRFDSLLKTLEARTDDASMALALELTDVVPVPEAELTRNRRIATNSPEKVAARAAMVKTLVAAGIDSAIAEKMSKAI